MLTYEELAPVMYKAANRLALFSQYKYLPDELVNACWSIGTIQKLKDIRLASKRAYYDMIDYIRNEEKGRRRKQLTFISLEPELYIPIEKAPVIIFKDFVEWLIEDMTRRDKLIVKLWLEGFDNNEIARITGYHHSRISQILPQVFDQLREKIQEVSSEQ